MERPFGWGNYSHFCAVTYIFFYRFDVAQYKPEEVTVKTVDNRLLVHAKHEEKTPSRTVYREYNQVSENEVEW